jgi:hypothetical protein
MSEEEKFDDLLRSKLTEREFLFDEHNWDKAERKIERAENQRKFRRIGAIFLGGVIVGVLIMLPFMNSNKNGVTQQTSSTTTDNAANQVAINQPSTNSTTISNSPSTTLTTAPSHPISSGSDNGTSQPVVSANKNVSGGNNSISGTNNNNSSAVTPTASKPTIQKTVVPASNGNDQLTYVRPEKEKHSRKPVNANTSSTAQHTTTSPTIASANNTNSVHVPSNNQQENTSTGTNNITVNSTNVNKPVTSNPDLIQSNNTTSSSTPTTNENTASTSKATIKDSTTTSSTTSPDTTANSPDGFINPPPTPKKSSSSLTTFSIDAGAGYALGWMKDGATQGNGISPIIGISTTHYFNGTWSGYLGVQFNMLTNVNTLYASNADQYSFGLNTNVNSVTLKTFYYAAVPIRLQYCFGFNNMISLGANVLYLVNTKSSVVTYNQDYFGTSGYTSANKMGYMDGINAFDVQAVIAYKRKINRITASAEFYYGLLDIEDNSFFNNNVFERNSGFRLILSYDIIK